MKINGRAIAQEIYEGLIKRVTLLKKKGIVPHIAVILVGNDPASQAFVEQKRKWSAYIGAEFSLIRYPHNVSQNEILDSIKLLNDDARINGIIVQRPLPEHIDKQTIVRSINPLKDIDGFRPDSKFTVPVAAAIITVLNNIFRFALYNKGMPEYAKSYDNFLNWLKSLSIVVVGKGETAGGPIISHLQKLGLKPLVVSSKTENREDKIRQGELVITAVGKSGIITPDMLKKDVILLGVGMHKEEDGKLHGDYRAKDIMDIASYYTAVTGGIGPVNVANLLSNLVTAAENVKK